MNTYRATATALIPAPTHTVYAIIADYRDGHPRILPRPPFVSLEVEKGGRGAGTIVRFEMSSFGRTQAFRATITEPEPGRVLVETTDDGGPVTTFTVDPRVDGQHAQVTIATEGALGNGWLAWLERALTVRYLQGIYAQELAWLAKLAAEPAGE